MFKPEPEPGDRWRWALVVVACGVVLTVLHSRAVRPVTYLVIAAVGTALLVLAIAALIRLLR